VQGGTGVCSGVVGGRSTLGKGVAALAVAAALLACALALFAPGGLVPSAQAKKTNRVVLSPHTGQTVPARPLTIRLHTGSRPHKLRAWLNGRPIHKHFDRPSRRGVRKLEASPNHGLRHGTNRLRVRVRLDSGKLRVAHVRFRVRGNRPLAAAGVDRDHTVGATAYLDGRRSLLHPKAGPGARPFGHGGLRYRWRIVDAPSGSSLGGGGKARGAAAAIDGAGTPTPSLTPDVPGSYSAKLTVTAADGQTGSNVVDIETDPSPAVPVDTMAEEGGNFNFGIRVGTGPGSFYPAKLNSWAQLVTLNRSTLQPDPKLPDLANKSYNCPFSQVNPGEDAALPQCVQQLQADLNRIDPSHIVIVSNQPWEGTYEEVQAPYRLEQALGRIGVAPTAFSDPPNCQPCDPNQNSRGFRLAGSISAIGVPGTPQGEGTWHAVPSLDAGTGQGQITGYLALDNAGKYGFQSYDRILFDTQAEGTTESQNVIKVGDATFPQSFAGGIHDGGGFQVVVLDPQTLEGSSHFFETDHADVNALRGQVRDMRDLIHGVNAAGGADRKLVFITSLGMPAIQYYRRSGSNPNDGLNTEIAQLVNEVEQLGGTRSGFYKAIDPDLYGTNGYSYTLFSMGNSGAARGNEQLGTGISGTGAGPLNTARMSGTLARSGPNYGFVLHGALRIGAEEAGRNPSRASAELLRIAFQAPTPWPEQGNAGRTAAIKWIGQHALSTSDPRGQYWTRAFVNGQFDFNGWNKTAFAIQALTYPADPPPSTCVPEQTSVGFCPADLTWAKTELAGPTTNPAQVGGEIAWLEQAHTYLDSLATPFSGSQLQNWSGLQSTVNLINQDVKADKAAAIQAANWKSFFLFAADLAEEIPGVGKAFAVANDSYELAAELAEHNGESVEDGFGSTAAEVGDRLADRLVEAQNVLHRQLPNIIAADYGKLKTVGACAVFDEAICPFSTKDWQYTQADQAEAAEALLKGTKAWAYGELLPAKYTLFSLPEWYKRKVDNQFHARDLANHYPFPGLPDTAQYAKPVYRNIAQYSHATVGDANLEWTMTGGSDRWQIFALGHLDRAGTTFDPFVMQFPTASVTNPLFGAPPGGLGIDPETFFVTQFAGKDQTKPLEHYPTGGTDVGWCELNFSCP
jgi:hypothetical protein